MSLLHGSNGSQRAGRNTTRRWLKMALAVPGEDPTDKDHYHILVASPGRLLDLLCNQTTTSFFELTTYVVVDEADFLLKKAKDGSNQTLEILSQLRPDIQMLCFTATWDEDLPKEIGKILKPADWRATWMNLYVIHFLCSKSESKSFFAINTSTVSDSTRANV